MTNAERLPIFPTRMNLKLVNNKLEVANRGHRLLKSKCDALNLQFKKIQEKMEALNSNTTQLFKEAFISLSKAKFMGANIELFIKDSEKYPIDLKMSYTMVSGITLPNFTVDTNFDFDEVHGRGATHFLETRRLFKKLIILLIDISSVTSTFKALKSAIQATNRRINSLEHMMIPRLEKTQKFISCELDEQEREEFFRLKKIQSMNKK